MNETLYRRTRGLGIGVEHVAEVGVYYPETSNVLGFIEDGTRADLFEADPLCVEKVRERFAGSANVQVHPFAIYHTAGTVTLYRTHASTFVEGVQSPALRNDGYQPTPEDAFQAEARIFSDFDDGTIDLLSVDVEGCEWFVLQHLRSRPKIMSLETQWRRYRNEHLGEIERWMRENGYRVWYREGSDTVYIHASIPTGFGARWRARRSRSEKDA